MKITRLGALSALLILLLCCLYILPAAAEDEIQSGSCGDSLTWSYDPEAMELTISGSGAMDDFSLNPSEQSPWYIHRSSIRSVTVEAGVTSIGNYAFLSCENLISVTLPQGLSSIGSYAFGSCAALTEIVLPEGLLTLKNNAFMNCITLQSVKFPASLTEIGASTFSFCGKLELLSLPRGLTTVGANAFNSTPIRMVVFNGTEEEWEAVRVDEPNSKLTEALLIHPEHTYDREVISPAYLAADATCETATAYVKSCICGEKGEELFYDGDPLGHMGGDATCTEKAICDTCSQPYGELLPHEPHGVADCTNNVSCSVCETVLEEALGHSYENEITPPTCQKAGYTTHTCSVCEHSYNDTPVEPLPHTPGDEPTCTSAQTCQVCGEQLADKLEHSYTSKDTLAPTCTENGTRTHTCSLCENTYEETIQATGHNPGAQSCTANQTCTVCETVLAAPLGHNYQDTVIPPTCTAQGYTDRICTRCQEQTRDTYVPAKGHTPGAAPTCTSPQTCTVCSALLASQLSHSYTSAITLPATCTQSGIRTHTCRYCASSYEETISPLGHSAGEAATCITPQTCLTCGTILATPTEHTTENSVILPTCDSQGYTQHTCTVCSVSYIDTVTPAVGHTPGDAATCHSPQTCTVCHMLLAEALSHQYEETAVEVTCTADGCVRRTCSLCQDTFIVSVTPATGHTEGDWTLVNHPDVGEPGRRQKACDTCSAVLEYETFWSDETISEPGSSESTSEQPLPNAGGNSDDTEEGGCQNIGGNILVIFIVLAALFLLWFLDFRRKH